MSDPRLSGDDPRRAPGSDLAAADLAAQPMVARAPRGVSLWVALAALAVVSIGLFAWLTANRHRMEATSGPAFADAAPGGSAAIGAAPPPAPLPLPVAPAAGPLTAVPAPQFTTNNSVPPPLPMATPMAAMAVPGVAPAAVAQGRDARLRAPALVVDLGGGPTVAAGVLPIRLPGNPALAPATGNRTDVSDEERFAARIGDGEPERVVATRLRNLSFLVPQGATIAATLETALDSDLPGYARAVVARDVKSFDGRNVLIPRGARVIGQYKSGVALGASRVFVIWTRVIRPDGASIQIASPGADDLGRAGLTGKVDRHFFTRFGGAILLSVINAGVGALSNLQNSAQVYIGSSADASNVAAAALQKDGGAPPTIRTPQGAAVSIFVARDLDFSTVGPSK